MPITSQWRKRSSSGTIFNGIPKAASFVISQIDPMSPLPHHESVAFMFDQILISAASWRLNTVNLAVDMDFHWESVAPLYGITPVDGCDLCLLDNRALAVLLAISSPHRKCSRLASMMLSFSSTRHHSPAHPCDPLPSTLHPCQFPSFPVGHR
jgi:hypothetical protein